METPSINAAYKRYAKMYDQIFGRMFLPRMRHVISKLSLTPGQKVLEIGVGTGVSLPVYPYAVRVVGIDISDDMMEQAKKKKAVETSKIVHLLKMDGRKLAFADNSFDHSMVAHVVSVTDNPEVLLKEVQRVTRPGGGIVIINHFKSNNPIIGKILDLLSPLCEKLGWHSNIDLLPLIEESNLRVESVYKLYPFDLWQIVWAKSV